MITNQNKVFTLIFIIVMGIIILEGIALLKGFDGAILSIAVTTLGSIGGYLFGRKAKRYEKDDHVK